MRTLSRIIALTVAIGAFPAAYSQNHPTIPSTGKVNIVNASPDSAKNEEAVVNVYQIFIENAPKTFKKSGVPSFAIEGKEGKFYLGIGATAKATVSYDWGDPIDNGFDFTTSAIPMNPRKGDGGLFQLSGATSGMYLNFVALPGDKNQVGFYFDFNLTGNNYGFNLTYAYVKYRGITAGYDYSLFSDMAAAPPSIDYEGPCGFTAIPHGVLDYRHSINSHWSFGVGAEMPMVSATTGDHTYTVNQRVPDIPAYIQYSWGGGKSWLRFSGIVRNMLYRDVIADKNRDIVGWGVKMSGSASMTPFVTAYYQAAYGKGITSYFQDLYEGGLDMVPDACCDGRLSAVKAWGGYLGLQYNISPKVYATTTYSHLRNYAPSYEGGSTPWDSQYKYAQYALANVMWSITPHISTGLEYIYGRRVDMNGASHHDNRIQTMLQVTF